MNRTKILIVVIIILLTVSLFCIKVLLLNTKDMEISDIQNNNIMLENIISENDVTVANNQIDTDVQNMNTEINVVTEQNVITSSITTNTTHKNKKNTQEEKKVQQVTTTEVESVIVTEAERTPNTEIKQKVQKENIIIESKPETPQQPQNTTSTVIQKPTEKYVRNDNMINKIKQVIQNNESENMKKFGYNIVVDSSIKELTNQFTFYESRVINYLKYKSGTIRIYAEDCYKNGQFIMTQCYII